MDSHPLVKLAYMLYWVSSTIVYGKCWLMETPRKLSPLYSTRERQLGDAIQGLAHGIVGQALVRWACGHVCEIALPHRKKFRLEGFLISACIHYPHHC